MLGHTRLSIIDLSVAGKQPMPNEDGTVWIGYNGEVYNFQELRRELEQNGHRFRSGTDTEVILHAYEEWGEGCVKRLRGMFSFTIYDCRLPIAGVRCQAGGGPRSTVHGPRSTVHGSRSTVPGPRSTVHGPRSTVHG